MQPPYTAVGCTHGPPQYAVYLDGIANDTHLVTVPQESCDIARGGVPQVSPQIAGLDHDGQRRQRRGGRCEGGSNGRG